MTIAEAIQELKAATADKAESNLAAWKLAFQAHDDAEYKRRRAIAKQLYRLRRKIAEVETCAAKAMQMED